MLQVSSARLRTDSSRRTGMKMRCLAGLVALVTASVLLSGCGNSCGCDSSHHFIIEIDGKVLRKRSGSTELVSPETRLRDLDDSHTYFDAPEEEWKYGSDGKPLPLSTMDLERSYSAEMNKIREEIKSRHWQMYVFSCRNIICEENGFTIFNDDRRVLYRHKGSYSLKRFWWS